MDNQQETSSDDDGSSETIRGTLFYITIKIYYNEDIVRPLVKINGLIWFVR